LFKLIKWHEDLPILALPYHEGRMLAPVPLVEGSRLEVIPDDDPRRHHLPEVPPRAITLGSGIAGASAGAKVFDRDRLAGSSTHLIGQVPPHPDQLKDDTVASATRSRSVIEWTCPTCISCSIRHVLPVTPRTFSP
jgi:hypothetical protein